MTVEGDPIGEALIDFCPPIIADTGMPTGSSTAPTKCRRPFGASVAISRGQSNDTLTVTSTKSNLPAAAFQLEGWRESSVLCAPNRFASSALSGDEVNAVTLPELEKAKDAYVDLLRQATGSPQEKRIAADLQRVSKLLESSAARRAPGDKEAPPVIVPEAPAPDRRIPRNPLVR